MAAPAKSLDIKTLLRKFRIVSGAILFAFAATHLLNHALGLVSLDVMEAARSARVFVTRSIPGTFVLASALMVHLVLGLATFVNRRSWRMKWVEGVQLLFGLLIPILMFRHMIGTRLAHELYGVDDRYTYALFVLWPGEAWRQILLITLVWVHGVIGMHMWLRMKSWYMRFPAVLLGFAILTPVLGFAGFATAGRMIRTTHEFEVPFTTAQFLLLKSWMDYALWGYGLLLGVFLLLRLGRTVMDHLAPKVKVDYVDGPDIAIAPGMTVLEISRANGIPHASVCGGRARCSTCRVRIMRGQEAQEAAGEAEQRVLDRVGATPNVRLACQLRPCADLSIVPLLPAQKITAGDVAQLDKYFWGVEQTVTLLFADIRGFTRMSENQLPYDVVFLLNQYLARMSECIEDAGGYVDKFMGDGIMAIFGMDRPTGQGAEDALTAARAMGGVLDALNQSMRDELSEPLNIGIGIHTGVVILGRIGVSSASGAGERITALGDTVNTASRLESACKELKVQLVVSSETLKAAGMDTPAEHSHDITVRGKSKPLKVLALRRAVMLQQTAPAEAPE